MAPTEIQCKPDLTGMVFGTLEIIRFIEKPKRQVKNNCWLARCLICGHIKPTCNFVLRSKPFGCKVCFGLKRGEAGLKLAFDAYKANASKRHLQFDLTDIQFRYLTSQPCHYCGVLPSQCRNNGNRKKPKGEMYGDYLHNGIDRENNSVGYTFDNCLPCCGMCNFAKSSMSYEDFVAWIDRLKNHKGIIMAQSETAMHRGKVIQYCVGNGLDIGSGGDPVVPTAIQIDLPKSYCPLFDDKYPIALRGDARNLYWFKDEVLDYVYSSHLLEDFKDWEPILTEWVRVLKKGGHLVILLPDHQRFRAAVAAGQGDNLAHQHESFVGELSSYAEKLGLRVLEDRFAGHEKDYNIMFVGQRV